MNSNQKQTFERVEDDRYLTIDAVDGDELYERYLRMFDKINGTDLADLVSTRR
jgi:hypothetical protein